MKIMVPKIYTIAFEGLPPTFERKETEKQLEVFLPAGFLIHRDVLGMGVKEFQRFFREIKVLSSGRKLWRGNEIWLEPMRTARLDMRVSPTERDIIKKAAKLKGKTVTEYCLETIIPRVFRDLPSEESKEPLPKESKKPGGTRGS
jgi:hypothetical protein